MVGEEGGGRGKANVRVRDTFSSLHWMILCVTLFSSLPLSLHTDIAADTKAAAKQTSTHTLAYTTKRSKDE